MLEEQTEKELILAAKTGDDAAWALIMRAHQEAVFRFAYLQLRDPAEAEDIAQESFIRAHKYLSRFDATRPFKPWVMRITANLAHNRRRSLGRYLAALKNWAQNERLPKSVPEINQENSDADALWAAVSRLSPNEQSVIYLRYFLEMPVAETAETLGIAEGTVKSRLNRALKKLQGVILKDFPELAT